MQLSLFGGGAAELGGFARLHRIALDAGSWIDYVPEFVRGHEALFTRLATTMAWKAERRVMYEREVDVPRLLASSPLDPPLARADAPLDAPLARADAPLDPLLAQVARALASRYQATFERVAMAYYRDGRDSVAWHRDKMPRDRETLACILSLGAPRKFMVRPFGGGPARGFALGNGDLFVLGGWCQLRWEHCVPKQKYAAPRMSCMFRHVYA